MLNQFIRIQIRNIGLIAARCPMDGLFGMVGTGQRRNYSHNPYESGPRSTMDRFLVGLSDRPGWTKRLYRLRHWHAQLSGLRLQQG